MGLPPTTDEIGKKEGVTMDLKGAMEEAGDSSIRNVIVNDTGVYVTLTNGIVIKSYPNE
jgi:hypothetical protein